MLIWVGVVTYNPNMERLNENIRAICNQVDGILIVDNGSYNVNEIFAFPDTFPKMEIIHNNENRGIASALKQIMEYAEKDNIDWMLTMDQDSVCQPGLVDVYRKYTKLDDVGILTCNIIDRNFVQNTGFLTGQTYREIKQCITSGSLINVNAYGKSDGFDERLFIDLVDFDICINLRRHGFKIIKINFDGVLHEVGHGKNVKLFGKDYITYGETPMRQYYIARNHLYLLSKYPEEFSTFREILREIREELLILMYEEKQLSKLKNRWKGIIDALKKQI